MANGAPGKKQKRLSNGTAQAKPTDAAIQEASARTGIPLKPIDVGEPLADPLEEEFAILAAGGMSFCSAYISAYQVDYEVGHANSFRMRKKKHVLDRIAHLRKISTTERAQIIQALEIYHMGVLGTPVGHLTEQSHLIQGVKRKQYLDGDQPYEVTEIIMPDKTASAKELARLHGLYPDQKLTVDLNVKQVPRNEAEEIYALVEKCRQQPVLQEAVVAVLEEVKAMIAERKRDEAKEKDRRAKAIKDAEIIEV
jgi:hypothetical protein